MPTGERPLAENQESNVANEPRRLRRLLALLVHPATSFLSDLLDRSAELNDGRDPVDFVFLGIAALANSVSALDGIQKLVSGFADVPRGALPLATSVLGMIVTCFVISAKTTKREWQPLESVPTPALRTTYRYAQPARSVAKILLPVLSVILMFSLVATASSLKPLPSQFYGYLLDGASGLPLPDLSVRVFDQHGSDLTKGALKTDSRGFYIVEMIRNANRQCVLQVYPAGCHNKQELPLTTAYETRLDPSGKKVQDILAPVFLHRISCGENK
jgi:hypothetical protein